MIFYDLPAEIYHARDEISKSGLDKIARSPAHYQAYKAGQTSGPQQEFMIGSAVHARVLEPDLYCQTYAVAPEGLDRRTKAGKEAYAELAASGKLILSPSDSAQIEGIANAVLSSNQARSYLEGKPEVSFTANLHGVDCRGRVDLLGDGGLLVDLKTTKDASAKGFASSIVNYRYHVQAAIYLDLCRANDIEATDFVFIAVEKEPPYALGIYVLDETAIDAGRRAYMNDLSTYSYCLLMDEWPGYDAELRTLSLPPWAI